MRLRRSACLALFAVSGLLQPAFCQMIGSGGGIGFVSGFGGSMSGLKGFPYSAEFVTKTVQTLADGTHITREQKEIQARDSEGRTRNEVYLPEGEGSLANQPVMVTIIDPVGGQFIHLNAQQKTANVSPFAMPAQAQTRPARQVPPPSSVPAV